MIEPPAIILRLLGNAKCRHQSEGEHHAYFYFLENLAMLFAWVSEDFSQKAQKKATCWGEQVVGERFGDRILAGV
jgi:hypothetical protein